MQETQSSQSSKTWLIGIIVVALLVIGGYAVMNRSTSTVTTPGTSIPTSTTGSMTNEAVMEITVEGKEFAFSPSILMLKVGQPVRLTFKNMGKMQHDFIIDEIVGAKTAIVQGGQTTTVEFTPTKTGSFKFYCGVGNHRAQGMEGTVTVQ